MRTATPALSKISSCCRLFAATGGLALLLVFGTAHSARAQNSNQLTLSNNFFVTGDYVVGGVGLRGLGNATGFATGTINVPDNMQPNAAGVPAGADIIAAYLYWETVEKSQSAQAGKQGFFNNYPIVGARLGNDNAPVSWSSGGCSGSSNGTTTMRVYVADVRPYLPLDANGNIQTPNAVTPGSYMVKLADSGSNGGGTPLTLGATLVLIYRVQSPLQPLRSVVLYDGVLSPSNAGSTMTLPIQGFYQPGSDTGAAPLARITHIVGNGQLNKFESVSLNGANLPSVYGNSVPPFPGRYNGSWDNPTWVLDSLSAVTSSDTQTTVVVPSSSNSGCVNWGAVIFSTTVKDTDHDGILDVWEDKVNPGYFDYLSNQFVALPGAKVGQKDLFVELDYVVNYLANGITVQHSHLPKQQAIDMVGDSFAKQGISVHFDVGTNYNGVCKVTAPISVGAPTCPDPYIIQGGTGGNSIAESQFVCLDGATYCAFPNQATVGWKGGVQSVQLDPTLGNFQPGRKDSYHYVLFAHGLGMPRIYWASAGLAPSIVSSGVATLNSITVSNGVGTVVITTPPGFPKPGEAGCSDANCDRVTVDGALLPQPTNISLNGTYLLGPSSPGVGPNQTTFNIQTPGVLNGTYDYFTEPELVLSFGGPESVSGFSDVGGADSTVTFGLWPADDATGCQADPTKPGPYCSNQVGTITGEAGTLHHELGHTLFLTHGGTFFPNGAVNAGQQTNSQLEPPSYGLNCNPAFLSSMNYLFQIRGFPDGGIDYSGQTLPSLSEASLNEVLGLGKDIYTQQLAKHLTRWFAVPNAIDNLIGTSASQVHCDGTPTAPGEQLLVRVDGNPTIAPMIDWNNDLVVANPVASQDVNFDGSSTEPPASPAFNNMQGFNDWVNLDLRQIGARAGAFGSSGNRFTGGGNRFTGGGNRFTGGGNRFTGGGNRFTGGGSEQDSDLANATADSPLNLNAKMSSHSVLLTWGAPDFGQFRVYTVWRATGSFASLSAAVGAKAAFTNIGSIGKLTNPGPPSPLQLFDGTVKNNTSYTYFVTGTNIQAVQSAPSATVFIRVKF
jgi:hypothetical protein